MKKYIVPIFLVACILFSLGSLIVFGQCTVTQSASSTQNDDGTAIVPLHFVYGLGLVADINCTIPLGANASYVSDFSSGTCNGLEAQATAVANAPGVGGIISTTGTVLAP